MPRIEEFDLILNANKTEEYQPSVRTENGAIFVNADPDAVFNSNEIRASARPAAVGNTGRTASVLGIRPIHLEDSNGCCIDVTKPEGNTFQVTTMIRKTSSAQAAEELVDMLVAYVSSADFRELVTKSSYY